MVLILSWKKSATELSLRGCDVVLCCCRVGEILNYVEEFFVVVGAVFDAGG